MVRDPRILVLMGPTAAGKSALALTLAKKFGGEVINADSRQIYVGMDIGTDKAGKREIRNKKWETRNDKLDGTLISHYSFLISRHAPLLVEGVPHYLIDILTPDQPYSAAEFRNDATRIIADIHRRGKLPIVVGGTGFYLRVLTGGQVLPNVPPDPKFRKRAEQQPLAALVRELRDRAPDLAARVDDLRNRRRVTRALEIARARGDERQGTRLTSPPSVRLLKLVLLPPPDELRKRIEHRVDAMLERGFIAEVQRLVTRYGEHAPGLQTVGYRQVLPYLHGHAILEETRAAVLRAHWDYARRQLTWLKREPNVVRVSTPTDAYTLAAAFLR